MKNYPNIEKTKAPEYARKGYFMDKTLTADSFTIKAKP